MADTAVAALTAASALTGTELFYGDDGVNDVKVTANQVKTWTSSSPVLVTPGIGASDVILTRDAANQLAQVNGTNANSFHVYNTSSSANANYERGVFGWTDTSNVLTIGTQNAGTGVARTLQFVVGGVNKLDYGVTNSGTWTLGAGFNGGGSNISNFANISIGNTGAFFWATRSVFQSPSDGVIELSNSAITDFGRLQFGGTTASFPAIIRASAGLVIGAADVSAPAALQSSKVVTAKTGNYQLLFTDNDTQFNNIGAAGEVDFTLPTSGNTTVGMRYGFYVGAAQILKVIANTGVTIRVAGSVSSSAGNITNSTIGGYIEIVATSTTTWVAKSTVGTWTTA